MILKKMPSKRRVVRAVRFDWREFNRYRIWEEILIEYAYVEPRDWDAMKDELDRRMEGVPLKRSLILSDQVIQ
jgi:hypothetical protein